MLTKWWQGDFSFFLILSLYIHKLGVIYYQMSGWHGSQECFLWGAVCGLGEKDEAIKY